MGLILFIGINWLLLAILMALVRKPAELKNMARSWITHPIRNAFMLVWLSSVLFAGWGILSAGRLSWPVSTPWGEIASWQLGGILSFVGLGVLFVFSAYDNHQHRNRYLPPPGAKK